MKESLNALSNCIDPFTEAVLTLSHIFSYDIEAIFAASSRVVLAFKTACSCALNTLPACVVDITVCLSRTSFSPLVDSLAFSSDTLAILFINCLNVFSATSPPCANPAYTLFTSTPIFQYAFLTSSLPEDSCCISLLVSVPAIESALPICFIEAKNEINDVDVIPIF